MTVSELSDARSYELTISREAMPQVISTLVSGLYKNPREAALREYVSNARDAHRRAGVTRPVEVSLPTVERPEIVIRDYGQGMTAQELEELYAGVGSSDKRSSDEIGTFGYGAKSGYAVSDTWYLTSICDGLRHEVTATLVEGIPTHYVSTHSADENDHSGVEVRIPAKKSAPDYGWGGTDPLKEYAENLAFWLDDGELEVSTESNDPIRSTGLYASRYKGHGALRILSKGYSKTHIVVAKVPVTMDHNTWRDLVWDAFNESVDRATITHVTVGNFSDIRARVVDTGVVLLDDPKSVDFVPSRDTVQQTKKTENAIISAIRSVIDPMLKSIDTIAGLPSVEERTREVFSNEELFLGTDPAKVVPGISENGTTGRYESGRRITIGRLLVSTLVNAENPILLVTGYEGDSLPMNQVIVDTTRAKILVSSGPRTGNVGVDAYFDDVFAPMLTDPDDLRAMPRRAHISYTEYLELARNIKRNRDRERAKGRQRGAALPVTLLVLRPDGTVRKAEVPLEASTDYVRKIGNPPVHHSTDVPYNLNVDGEDSGEPGALAVLLPSKSQRLAALNRRFPSMASRAEFISMTRLARVIGALRKMPVKRRQDAVNAILNRDARYTDLVDWADAYGVLLPPGRFRDVTAAMKRGSKDMKDALPSVSFIEAGWHAPAQEIVETLPEKRRPHVVNLSEAYPLLKAYIGKVRYMSSDDAHGMAMVEYVRMLDAQYA